MYVYRDPSGNTGTNVSLSCSCTERLPTSYWPMLNGACLYRSKFFEEVRMCS